MDQNRVSGPNLAFVSGNGRIIPVFGLNRVL